MLGNHVSIDALCDVINGIVLLQAKKGSKKGLKDSSRPSVSDEDDKVGSLKSKQDKKRGKGKRKKAERMGYKEVCYGISRVQVIVTVILHYSVLQCIRVYL